MTLMANPVPAVVTFKAAPELEAYFWLTVKTSAESVQLPAVTVQLEAMAATAPVVVKAPPVLVVRSRLRFNKLPELATVVV